MNDPTSRTRAKWAIAGAVIAALAITLAWATWGGSPRGPDDPAELLRRAQASVAAGGPKLTGKVVEAEGTSSSGAPVHVRLPEVRDASGNVGYAPHLREPLKPGETATINLPGGGSIIMGMPKDGEAPKLPGAVQKAPAD